MEQGLIDELINSFKMIVYDNPMFNLPPQGLYDNLDLKSNHLLFIVDINRRGRKNLNLPYNYENSETKINYY